MSGWEGRGSERERERKAVGQPFDTNCKIKPTVPPPQTFFFENCFLFSFPTVLFCFVLKCEFVRSVGWLAGLKSQMWAYPLEAQVWANPLEAQMWANPEFGWQLGVSAL